MINISKKPNMISKVNFRGEEYYMKDEDARNNIKNLKREIQDLKEDISIIKSEIKEINKKLNNETFNFS